MGVHPCALRADSLTAFMCYLVCVKKPVGGQRARSSEVRSLQNKPPKGAWLSCCGISPIPSSCWSNWKLLHPGGRWPPSDRTVWELLDLSQLISSPFAFQPQGPCVDQSLNPDRWPPALVHGIPLGPSGTLVPFPGGKVHVPPGHEIMWSQPSLLGCGQ